MSEFTAYHAHPSRARHAVSALRRSGYTAVIVVEDDRVPLDEVWVRCSDRIDDFHVLTLEDPKTSGILRRAPRVSPSADGVDLHLCTPDQSA